MSNLPEPTEAPKATAVSKRDNNPMLGRRGFEFDLNSAIRFATGLADSGMAPKGMKAGAIVALLEAGKELGLAPMFALGNLTLVNGRLGIMGDAAKALIRASGTLKPGTDFSEMYSGDPLTESRGCTVTAWRNGQPMPFSRTFCIADAVQANLVRIWTYPRDSKEHPPGSKCYQSASREGWGNQGPWATYTDRMLMYRAIGFLCRDFWSDVLGGAIITEELADYPKTNAVSAVKAELVRRFSPEGAVDVATMYEPPCDHAAGSVERITPSDVPDEPPVMEDVCAGCGESWKTVHGEATRANV